jgi:hypothetical protein
LERAEGVACAQYAEARRRLFPDSGAGWMQCAGAYAVFDGVDSPITQTFGLGVFEELSPASLDAIERFFLDRGAPVLHEMSPFAAVAALDLRCRRNYRPAELSNVLYRSVEQPSAEQPGDIRVRLSGLEETQLFWRSGLSPQRVNRVCASSLNWTLNPARRACSASTIEWRYLAARPRFQSCGVAACKPHCFTNACATPSNMDAIWQ